VRGRRMEKQGASMRDACMRSDPIPLLLACLPPSELHACCAINASPIAHLERASHDL
jgi:hypothetical protein